MSVEINSNVPVMTNEKEPVEVASEGSDLFKSVKIESTESVEVDNEIETDDIFIEDDIDKVFERFRKRVKI